MEQSKSRYVQTPLTVSQKRLFVSLTGIDGLEFDFREYLDGALARLRQVRKDGVHYRVLDPGPSDKESVSVYYPGFPVVQPLRKLEMDLWQWLLPEPYCQLALLFNPPPGVEIRYSSEGFRSGLDRLHRAFDRLEAHLVQAESSVFCVRTPAATACWLVQSLRHRITHIGVDPRVEGLAVAFSAGTLTPDALQGLLGGSAQYSELYCALDAGDPTQSLPAQVDKLIGDPIANVGGPPRDGYASGYELGL